MLIRDDSKLFAAGRDGRKILDPLHLFTAQTTDTERASRTRRAAGPCRRPLWWAPLVRAPAQLRRRRQTRLERRQLG
jgi:hypothetical protein